jgi:hypothetical protein
MRPVPIMISVSHLANYLNIIKPVKDPVQYQKMRGDWYLTADTGLNLKGFAKIDYENGTITSVKKKEWYNLDVSQRACAYSGNGPVALNVDRYGRLNVYADWPGSAARMALKRTGAEGAAQKPGSCLSVVEAELKGVEKAQKEKTDKAAASAVYSSP